jgi:hypothetical protein
MKAKNMKKKVFIPLIAVLIIAAVVAMVYSVPTIDRYEVQYIRVQYYDTEYAEFPLTDVISSMEELEQFREENAELFENKHDSSCSISLYNAVQKYTDEFFADSYLVVVALWEGSGSNRHKVREVDSDGSIRIDRLLPQIGAHDIATWRLLIELDRDFKPEEFSVTITDR